MLLTSKFFKNADPETAKALRVLAEIFQRCSEEEKRKLEELVNKAEYVDPQLRFIVLPPTLENDPVFLAKYDPYYESGSFINSLIQSYRPVPVLSHREAEELFRKECWRMEYFRRGTQIVYYKIPHYEKVLVEIRGQKYTVIFGYQTRTASGRGLGWTVLFAVRGDWEPPKEV